jgi:hypothetical protein
MLLLSIDHMNMKTMMTLTLMEGFLVLITELYYINI